MKEQTNIAIVKQCYDAYARQDMPRLLGFMDAGIDWELPDVPGIPFTGRRHGIDEVGAFFRQVNAAQTAREFTPKEFIAQGDKVVVLGHYGWTVNATGMPFDSDWTHVFTLRDGKVSAFREFLDSHAAAVAYGAHTLAHPTAKQAGRPSVH